MVLSFATPSDYAQMAEIYRPYVEGSTVSFEYTAPTAEQFAARMYALDGKFPVIVCRDGSTVLGYVYASPAFERTAYSWCADLSVYVRQGYGGRGMGRRLVNAVCAILTALGYRHLYSIVTGENAGSLAFHKVMGFEVAVEFPRQGFKMGKWLSVTWLHKELNGEGCSRFFPAPFNPADFDLKNY